MDVNLRSMTENQRKSGAGFNSHMNCQSSCHARKLPPKCIITRKPRRNTDTNYGFKNIKNEKEGWTILGLGETTVVDIIGQDSTVPQLLTTSHTPGCHCY